MKKKTEKFDYDSLTSIIGLGASVIEKELMRLAEKSEEGALTEAESKYLLSCLGTLRDIKKDYLAEMAAVQKELKGMTDEELAKMFAAAS